MQRLDTEFEAMLEWASPLETGESMRYHELPVEIHFVCISLGYDETHDTLVEWYALPKDRNAWRLLTPKGEYMRGADNEPITADSWPSAQQIAKQNSAPFIFSLHGRSVLYWHEPHKAWRTALIFWHPDFWKFHNTTLIRGDLNDKKPKPSGAEHRKRRRAKDREHVKEANLVAKERRSVGR